METEEGSLREDLKEREGEKGGRGMTDDGQGNSGELV